MREFISNLLSPWWWFSVVVVGILINLSSDWLRKRLDAVVARFSEKKRSERAAKAARREEIVQHLKSRTDELLFWVMEESRLRSRAQECLLGALIVTTSSLALVSSSPNSSVTQVGTIMLLFGSALLMMRLIQFQREASRIRQMVNDAREPKYPNFE